MKILFYVEPAIYRGNPTFITPHINNIRCLMNANRAAEVEFGLLTSPVLLSEYDAWLQHGGENDIIRFAANSRRMIEPFDFNMLDYSRYLYGRSLIGNDYLDEVCRSVADRFSPDVVLSFTQNVHLRRLFPSARVGFCEVGPLPRRDGRFDLYFDFGGHGSDSVLSAHLDRILEMKLDPIVGSAIAKGCLTRFADDPRFPAALETFESWRRENAAGYKIALIALSPADHPSAGGVEKVRSADELIAHALADLPEGWVGVPTYHHDMVGLNAMEAFFAAEFPAFRALPTALRGLGSDPFLPVIDGVVTVASKVGFSAALLGKRIVSLGSSLISGLARGRVQEIDDARQLTLEEAGKLVAFMSNRFVLSFEDCFHHQGKLVSFLRAVMASDDPISAQLDMTGWHTKRASVLAGDFC